MATCYYNDDVLGVGAGQPLAAEHEANEDEPASLAVLLALAISFPGMPASDPKRRGGLDHTL